MDKKEQARSVLSFSSIELFDDIAFSRVLGANKHIEMIGQMMIDIVEEENDIEQLIDRIDCISSYYKETRGNQSRAVYNAIQQMTKHLFTLRTYSLKEAKEIQLKDIKEYDTQAKEDLNKIVEYASCVCESMEAIMVFDYSSTLNAFLRNIKKKLTVYVCESRALDGGKPFLNACLEAGHDTHFIADSTMYECLKKCQAAFIGVETLYPDGTIFNTIGSDILAVLCEKEEIPLYALTPLMKVDTRPVYGYKRLSAMPYDFSVKIAKDWEAELVSKIDFKGIKLLEIQPKYIHAIITEKGIIPPSAMFTIAMEFANQLEVNSNVSK